LPDEQSAIRAVPLDESNDRSTGAEQSTADNPSVHAQEAGQPRRELERLTAENAALRAALSEEEKRNSELLLLVRRADKEMQDITQRDRDLAARLTKWREEVRNPTAFEYTAAKCSLTQHCCSTAC
jgi:predicted RNase H-like nuclease (RuvC/YqgF family)